MRTLSNLNTHFARPNHLTFEAGLGDLPIAKIRNSHASAIIALHGGQVLSFQPQDQAPLIWLSPLSPFQEGKGIRGGIPVCWP